MVGRLQQGPEILATIYIFGDFFQPFKKAFTQVIRRGDGFCVVGGLAVQHPNIR